MEEIKEVKIEETAIPTETVSEVQEELSVDTPVNISEPSTEKVMGDPSINEFDNNEEVILDKTNPPLKQKLSALYLIIKPEVDEFYSDKSKLNKKFDALYMKYSKRMVGCQNDLDRANKNLSQMKIELAKAEKEFQKHNENDFDPASFDRIVAPKADTVNLWSRFITMKSKELNRYRFLKTKIFAKEKSIIQFIKHSTAVQVIMACLKEVDYKNPFDETDVEKYNKVEELRKEILSFDEVVNVPEELSDEYVEALAKRYAISYINKKKETALQHRDLSIKLIDDAIEKYIGKINPVTPDENTTPEDKAEMEIINRRNKVKSLYNVLNNTDKIQDNKEREYLKDILQYADFWCSNAGVDFVIDTTDQLDPFIYGQLVSIYKRKVKLLAPVIFPGEPTSKAEIKIMLSFICTTLSDSIELCLGLL